MRRAGWQIGLGAALIAASALVYYAHYLIFHDAHHIFIYMVGDVAFVFIEVLLVTLVLHQLLAYREKRSLMKKMNMVIGAFFSEAGTGLLSSFADVDRATGDLRPALVIGADWSPQRFAGAARSAEGHVPDLALDGPYLDSLRRYLLDRREFLLRLLENPNLLEHESFTDLLWAVFHLTEELVSRGDMTDLPAADIEHLKGDVTRAYTRLVAEWVRYMGHLSRDYPYLFSLAARTNPFDPDARVEFA